MTTTGSRQQNVLGGSVLRAARVARRASCYRICLALALIVFAGHACGVPEHLGFTRADIPLERSIEVLGDANSNATERTAAAMLIYQSAVHAIDALEQASDGDCPEAAADSRILLGKLLLRMKEVQDGR